MQGDTIVRTKEQNNNKDWSSYCRLFEIIVTYHSEETNSLWAGEFQRSNLYDYKLFEFGNPENPEIMGEFAEISGIKEHEFWLSQFR